MKAKPFCLLVTAAVMAGAAAANAECLRMRITGEGTVKPEAVADGVNLSQAAREAQKHALVLAIRVWEKTASVKAGGAFGSYGVAQDKAESCQPLYRNLMSPVKCVVTATPCTRRGG